MHPLNKFKISTPDIFNGFLTKNANFFEKLPLGPKITILKGKVDWANLKVIFGHVKIFLDSRKEEAVKCTGLAPPL